MSCISCPTVLTAAIRSLFYPSVFQRQFANREYEIGCKSVVVLYDQRINKNKRWGSGWQHFFHVF